MNPYASLLVDREPFANTPDPAFLASTRQHATCLQELEISLRLRRGLSVVTGDIGTGKTTLCRGLVQALSGDADIDLHLMLDPQFDSSEEFLRVLLAQLSGFEPEAGLTAWQMREGIKQQLFRLGEEQGRLVVLIIDEGQKLAPENLELLRELLNYETNASKLLQIAIFGQSELEPLLATMPNLVDRINLRRKLVPLTLRESAAMIRHRLAVASTERLPSKQLFRPEAVLAVHALSGGSPRKIVRLCHKAMLETVLRGKRRVGLGEVLAGRQPSDVTLPGSRVVRAATGFVVTCLLVLALWLSLGGGGPVLRDGQAAGVAAQAGMTQQPDAGATLQADAGQPLRPVPEGVTLLPVVTEAEDVRSGRPVPALLTLAPETTGPTLRGAVLSSQEDATPERMADQKTDRKAPVAPSASAARP